MPCRLMITLNRTFVHTNCTPPTLSTSMIHLTFLFHNREKNPIILGVDFSLWGDSPSTVGLRGRGGAPRSAAPYARRRRRRYCRSIDLVKLGRDVFVSIFDGLKGASAVSNACRKVRVGNCRRYAARQRRARTLTSLQPAAALPGGTCVTFLCSLHPPQGRHGSCLSLYRYFLQIFGCCFSKVLHHFVSLTLLRCRRIKCQGIRRITAFQKTTSRVLLHSLISTPTRTLEIVGKVV